MTITEGELLLGFLIGVPVVYGIIYIGSRAFFTAKLRYQNELFKHLKQEGQTNGEKEE